MKRIILLCCLAVIPLAAQLQDLPTTSSPAVLWPKADANDEYLDALQRVSADCDGLTDGKSGTVCYDTTAGAIYVCSPSAGDCDTAGEWKLASGAGGSPGGSSGDYQVNDGAGGFAGRSVGAGLSDNGSALLVDTAVVPTKSGNNSWAGTQTFNEDIAAGAASSVDFTGADDTRPIQSGTTLPATCTADDELFIDTDATDGQQLYICNGTGTGWVLVGDGGGSSGYATIDDEDTPLTQRTTLNFAGAGVTCADDTTQTTCTIPGGGSGASDTLHVFLPGDNQPPSASYATIATLNGRDVLAFDSSADEAAIFAGVFDRGYGGAGVTVTAYVATKGITTGTVMLCGQWEDFSALDLDGDSFAAAQCSSATTVSGTDGQAVSISWTFTNGAQMDSVAAGEPFRLKIYRDVSADSGAADAQLLALEIKDGTS